ncbi:MAG TPA: hypothetical protein VG937_06685 [Polyangiaceae bacterium]|nr:hypothetical protein [Polyangiaceae bacterium]
MAERRWWLQHGRCSRAPSGWLPLCVLALACACKAEQKHKKPTETPRLQIQEAVAQPLGDAAENPCSEPASDRLSLIDDFEDGDGILPRVGDRNGSWYVATDGTLGASVRPPVGMANPERLFPARCNSNFAIHFAGRGFDTWGAVIGLNLRFERQVQPADVSAYKGLRFWTRANEYNYGVLRINLDDGATHPVGGVCSKATAKGEECWNSYTFEMPVLSREWEQHFVRFEEMTQKIPREKPTPADLSHVYLIGFKVSPGNTFDLWLDDVGLFK